MVDSFRRGSAIALSKRAQEDYSRYRMGQLVRCRHGLDTAAVNDCIVAPAARDDAGADPASQLCGRKEYSTGTPRPRCLQRLAASSRIWDFSAKSQLGEGSGCSDDQHTGLLIKYSWLT